MSYVYAEIVEKGHGDNRYKSINIYSDTKVEFDEVLKKGTDPKTFANISNFGLIKSLNIEGKVNISFAGNNFLCLTTFLSSVSELQEISEEELIEKAYKLHIDHQPDGIELIISFFDEGGNPKIVCIKNNNIERDCPFAYIGSEITRKRQLEIKNRLEQQNIKYSLDVIMQETFNSRVDDSVGSFFVLSSYSKSQNKFIYPTMFFTSYENVGYIKPNQVIPIYASAENGGYSYEQYENINGDIVLNFKQPNFSVVYTSNLRFNGDMENKQLKYLMLPIKFNQDTMEIL